MEDKAAVFLTSCLNFQSSGLQHYTESCLSLSLRHSVCCTGYSKQSVSNSDSDKNLCNAASLKTGS